MEVKKSSDFSAIRNDNFEYGNPSFINMIQAYSDKTARTLKENATLTYPTYIVSMNFIKEHRKFSVDYGRTLGELLLVVASKSIENG